MMEVRCCCFCVWSLLEFFCGSLVGLFYKGSGEGKKKEGKRVTSGLLAFFDQFQACHIFFEAFEDSIGTNRELLMVDERDYGGYMEWM